MVRSTAEEKAYFSENARKIYFKYELGTAWKWEMSLDIEKALKTENLKRSQRGLPILREPSYETFCRYLAKAVPADQMPKRPRNQ